MAYFLGIDGGGTRTVAWLADERKRILARAVAGPSNPLKVGFRVAQGEMLRAARRALRRAALKPRDLNALCVGLAGVDRPPVHRRLLRWLRQSIPAEFHLLTSDAAIALRAALGDSPGAVVISGTGSIAYGRDNRGRVLRSGGWGIVFDDAGSGYDLGRKAIAAALRDFDGRGPRTQLMGKICKALRLPDITQVVLRPLEPQQVAALFPLVLEGARRRDFVARRLCEEAGCDLADLGAALIRRLGWQRRVVPVVCAGGVFRASLRVRRSFTRHLRRQAPGARVLLLRRPPVEGALALARDLAGPPMKRA
jgi:N-acetylglucosamine kinase-like BadF-type ATPase